MKLNAQQEQIVTWTVLGLGGVALAYVLVKYVLPKLVGTAASGVGNTLNAANQGLGNNDLTNSQTDFAGDKVDYSGHGPVSTLGAEANGLSGGALASLGESIGSGLFSVFGQKPAGPSTYYTVSFPDGSKHAIGDTSVDPSGQFTYSGLRYQLGVVNGQRVATQIFGAGYSSSPNANFGAAPPDSGWEGI
jgi:hypothetical protein